MSSSDSNSAEEHPIFSLAFVKAVNDYQCGGNSAKKAERLMAFRENLPVQFRSCTETCYRQEAQDQKRVWDLIARTRLPMWYTSWTTDLEVAKAFKGGVTPNGQGVIIQVNPPPGSVVLNLVELYKDEEFHLAVELYKSRISRLGDGIGRYKHSQAEVILDLDTGTPASVYCFGGFTNAQELARSIYHHAPTSREIQAIESDLIEAGTQTSGWWLSHEGSLAVWRRIQPKLTELKKRKKLQDEG